MMLSKESEEFIANLRMYLMTSGKNSGEINDISDELRAHLEDAEKRGKTVDSITGDSPEAYLKTVQSEMTTDVFGILKSLPMLILLLVAYFITGSAIRGTLSFSLVSSIVYPVVAFLSFIAYIYFFRKMSVNNWSNKKMIIIFVCIQAFTIISLVVVLFFDMFLFEPIYSPSREVMWIIVVASVFIFIAGSLWSKSWITIILPLFLFGPDFIMHFTEVTDTQQLIISSSTLYIGMAAVLLFIFLKNKKQVN